MDYDFSGLCADQLEKLETKLKSLKKSFIKEYVTALQIINNENVNENLGAIKIEVADLFNDVNKKTSIFYTECLNKVQRIFINNLKG